MKYRFLAAAMAAGMLFAATAQAGPAGYTLTDFSAVQSSLFPIAINDEGLLIGVVGSERSYVYDTRAGQGYTLTSPSGANVGVNGLNNEGTIVGAYNDGTGSKAFVYSHTGGQFSVIPTPSDKYASAGRVNDAGLVVGTVGRDAFVGGPTFYKLLTDTANIPALVYYFGIDVSDNGKILTSVFADGRRSSFLQDADGNYLGGIGANSGDVNAQGLNNRGQVVGFDRDLAFVTGDDGQSAKTLLLPGGTRSFAYGINDSGDVVGESDVPGSSRHHAFVYTADGQLKDLNGVAGVDGTGWTIERALDINEAGQIVAWGKNPLGEYTAVLLSPVPEPATGVLALLAAVGVALAARRGQTRPAAAPAS